MYKQQKSRQQILVDSEDLRFIERFAHDLSANNINQAIHKLIYEYRNLVIEIEEIKNRSKKPQETYQEVRDTQIKQAQEDTVAKDVLLNDKWAWLRKAVIEDHNEQSKVEFKKTDKKKVIQNKDGSCSYDK